MARIELHRDVDAPRERVFELIADLHGYGRWLPSSRDYRGTSEISPPPVQIGTTYRETSPRGVRNGVVTEFDPSRSVVFHQPMTLRPRIAGTIDSTVTMRISASGAGSHATRVVRVVELGLPWWLAPLSSLIVRRYRDEGERMLRALKSFAEQRPQSAADTRRVDPYRNFRFRVRWEGRPVAGASRVAGLERGDAAIILERGLTHDFEFDRWATHASGSGADANPPPAGRRRDVVIEQYDEAGRLVTSDTVLGARVSDYRAVPDLDANENAVAIESLTLEHEGVRRDLDGVAPDA